jgi:hypothetical protein
MGSVVDVTNTIEYDSLQVRRAYSVGAGWHLDYQTVHKTISGFAKYDNRQTFTDEEHGKGQYNNCLHSKHLNWPLPYRPIGGKTVAIPFNISVVPTEWVQYGIQGVKWMGHGEFSTHWAPFSANLGFDFPAVGFPPIDWPELTNEVGVQLDGRMVTSQNLLVDLMQMTQTIGMFKNPFGLLKLMKKVGRKASLSSMSKYAASSLLEYKFGWENIYRDVQALANVWHEAKAHLAYLRAAVNRFVPISARQSHIYRDPALTLYEYGLGGGSLLRVLPKIHSIKRTACFSVNICRQQHEVVWSMFDQMMARLGSRDIAAAIWDLVPYSFIVDWFTHVGRFIAQKSISWHSFDLRNMGYSVKYDVIVSGRMISTFVNPFTFEQVSMQDDEIEPRSIQTSYARTRGFPPSCSSVGLFGSLNKTQIAEGAALIIQRL